MPKNENPVQFWKSCDVCKSRMDGFNPDIVMGTLKLCHNCFSGLQLFKFNPIILQYAVDAANLIQQIGREQKSNG